MSILISILLVIAGLIVLALIIALLAPKAYSLHREIVIQKPKQEVFDYIRHLKNQDQYNKWVMLDPNMKKDFKGTDGTVGFIYGWNGNKQAGEGEQEIKRIVPGERMEVEIRFVRPFAGVSHAPFVTESVNADQTKVTWGLSSKMPYPMNIMMLFMSMDKFLGRELEASLGLLKANLEKR